MKRNPKTVSIADDDRARIPFAVVGVLLLLSSATIVGYLHARPDPRSDIDPSLAFDRSEAATQSAIKDAVLDATDRVAASPVTEPADDGAFDELLGNDDTDPDTVFRRYTALVVYQEIHDRINGTSQTIRGNATATVTLPAIEDRGDAVEAMDRVSFLAGYERDDRQNGTVRVTVEDVTYEVRDEGDLVATREEDVTVTVATPVFQLHHRVGLYQERLEMSMLDGDGFEGLGREFAARTYPIVIGKSMWNYYRGVPSNAPFQEVVPQRQTEVLANHAIYGVQSKTFGTRDPRWEAPTKAGALCWLAFEANENYERGVGGNSGNSGGNNDGSSNGGSNSGGSNDGGNNGGSNSGGSDGGNDDGSGTDLGDVRDQGGYNASFLPTPQAYVSGQIRAQGTEMFCQGAEQLFEEGSLSADSVPSLWGLVTGSGNNNEMQRTENVSYALFAQRAFVDVHPDNEGSVDHESTNVSDENMSEIDEVQESNPGSAGLADSDLSAITDSVYSMDLDVSRSVSGPSFDIDPTPPPAVDDPDNWSTDTDTTTTDLGESVEITDDWQQRSDASNHDPKLFTVVAEDTVRRTQEVTWSHDESNRTETRTFRDTGNTTVTVEVYGEYAPGADLTQDGTYRTGDGSRDTASYEGHSGDVENLFQGDNGISENHPEVFDEAPENSFEAVFDVSRSGAASTFESNLDGDAHTSGSGVAEEINDPTEEDGTTLGPEAVTSSSRSSLEQFTEQALVTGRNRVINQGPRQYDRTRFLTGTPFGDMADHLISQRETVVYGGNEQDSFTAMPNFLRAAVLHQYHKTAVQYTNLANITHDGEMDQLGVGGSSLEEGVELSESAVNRDRPEYGGSMNSSDLLGNVSFEVRGSPTYLDFEVVNRTQVPAVRPEDAGAGDVAGADDVEHVPAVSCYNNRMGYFGLPLLPLPGSWYVTASSWRVEFEGEYARFEVTANVSEPSRATSLSYVREAKDVSTTIGGVEDEIGEVEPVQADTWAEFPMVVPAGKAGTGDPAHLGVPGASSPTAQWDFTGPGWEDGPDTRSECLA